MGYNPQVAKSLTQLSNYTRHAGTCPNSRTIQHFVMGIHGVVFQGYRPLVPPDKS